ncbi:hypothetical protein Ciccas_006254 [Cichlidogyrus casuarinus]|uniref:Solute carrier family 35 member F2 n=1 Tax=Cichlidogyrus casuarinus TaxID=1844966 RepID=A0ABD2Q698_9PLAT
MVLNRENSDVSLHSNFVPLMSENEQPVRPFLHTCLRGAYFALPSILMGQVLAVLLAGTGACNGLLAENNYSLPLFQNLWHYLLLSLLFAPFAFHRLKQSLSYHSFYAKCRSDWWKYLLASGLDVHANWAIVVAYSYTNVVSIQVLDCLSIASCMVLSRFIFKVAYKASHVLAILGCLGGMSLMIWADHEQETSKNITLLSNATDSNKSNISRALIGDIIVVFSALAYGGSNVIQEYLSRKNGSFSYLAISSLIAVVFQTCYFFTFEYRESNLQMLRNMNSVSIGSLVGYVLIMTVLYVCMSFMLPILHAVFTNLSMLTADFYALLLGLFLFKSVFTWQYLVAFFIIIISVVMFTLRPPKERQTIQSS